MVRNQTIAALLHDNYKLFTLSEKRLADYLLEHYPVSGLVSITKLAENVAISTPTVVRFIQKLKFETYGGFQDRLRQELEDTLSSPLEKHAQSAFRHSKQHILTSFADAVKENITTTLDRIDLQKFDALSSILQDQQRKIYFAGGRLTGPLAEYFYTHMQVIRPNIYLIPASRGAWPQHLLDVNANDVLIAFDIRRYSKEMKWLIQNFNENNGTVALFTDRWHSPFEKNTQYIIHVDTEVPSAWDSSVVFMVLIDALLENVQSAIWQTAEIRIKKLDQYFSHSDLFQKFDD